MRALLLAFLDALNSIIEILTPETPEPSPSVGSTRTRKTVKNKE